MMTFKYLAGYNKEENTIIINKVRVKDDSSFSMSSSIGQLCNCSKITLDDVLNMYESSGYFEAEYDLSEEDKINIILENMEIQYYSDYYRLILDCSCTDYEFTGKDDNLYNFETISCGQCCDSIRDFTSTDSEIHEVNALLLNLWKTKHLNTLSKRELERVSVIYDKLKDQDIYNLILKIFN